MRLSIVLDATREEYAADPLVAALLRARESKTLMLTLLETDWVIELGGSISVTPNNVRESFTLRSVRRPKIDAPGRYVTLTDTGTAHVEHIIDGWAYGTFHGDSFVCSASWDCMSGQIRHDHTSRNIVERVK